MRNRNKTTLACLFIGIIAVIFFVSCQSPIRKNEFPHPALKADTAKLLIQIVGKHEFSSLTAAYVSLLPPNYHEREAEVDSNGCVSFEIPLETSVAWLNVRSLFPYTEEAPVFLLEAGKETRVKLFGNEKDTMKMKMRIVQGLDLKCMNNEELEIYDDMIGRMLILDQPNYLLTKDSLDRFLLRPRDYASYAIRSDLGARLRIAEQDTLLSPQIKKWLTDWMNLLFAESLFRYPKAMSKIHGFLKKGNVEDTTTLNVPMPDRNYYTFLKEFNLNNPSYLYHPDLLKDLFQTLLRDQTLQIPRIEDRPVGEWLAEAKAILAELVGFEERLFYDLLVIYAYARQLNDEVRPLSDQQKKNLASYYKGGDVERILLRENEKTMEESQYLQAPIVVSTPDVPNEELLDAILSQYKGKVVVIDFWATWCAPCLDAMDKMKKLKHEMKDRDVVFVYFTNKSSPQDLWEEKIQVIGGEHYYFKEKGQWTALMDRFNFEFIPSYVVFNKKGECRSFEGYPGDDVFRRMLEALTKEDEIKCNSRDEIIESIL